MKKVVCIGGGNAMPNVVLPCIKKEKIDLSVISATLDSGGSSFRLREDFNIIAVGDLRRAFLELSLLENKKVLDYRFERGDLKGHHLLNLVIASILMKDENPIDVLNDFFKTQFKVFPATLDNVSLCAELENGEIIKGETNIDIPKHNSRIKRAFLDKKANIFKEAYEKLLTADAIIIGPGDLYSSLIQVLLVSQVKEAIKKSKAKVIYICNLKNKKGETDGFKVHNFADEIEKYLDRKLDFVIYNNQKGFDLVLYNEYNDPKYIGLPLLKENKAIHNSEKLIKKIMELIT